MTRRMIEKPFNSGQWSRARYFGFIRSGLRRMSVRWGPKNDALKAARSTYAGDNKRRKWAYTCARCGHLFAGIDVKVHHKVECGSLKSFADLPGFVERLFCEVGGFEVLCVGCHGKEHGRRVERMIAT